MKKILLVLTGGTICSFGDERGGNRDVYMKEANALLLQNFRKSGSAFADAEFETVTVLQVLSENMTIDCWNELIAFFKQVSMEDYQGIMIAHGTDTLSYTASLISLLFSKTKIPVFLVASNHPLNCKEANGNENFRYSVECICRGILPGTYVIYRNEDHVIYLHQASHLEACGDYSNNFYSRDALELKPERKPKLPETMKNRTWAQLGEGIAIADIGKLERNVLLLKPYVGLNYHCISLEDDVKAVVHGLYHSSTACVGNDEGRNSRNGYAQDSILWFLEKCYEKNISVIVTPCRENALYVSGDKMLKNGAIPVYGMTIEMVYVKVLLAYAMGFSEEDMKRFLQKNICGEYLATCL